MKDYLIQLKCKHEKYITKNHIKLYDYINQYNVGFSDIPFKQKVYNILNDIYTPPKCSCGNIVNFFNRQYSTYCSAKCSNNNLTNIRNRQKTFKNTIQSKYGVDSVFELKSVQNKIKETFNKNWGVDHISQSKELRQKAVDNQHRIDYVIASDKRKKTNILKYGVDNVAKLNFIQQKMKDTSVERYGVSHFSKTDSFREDVKNIMLKKYGVTHLMKDKEHVKNVSTKRKHTIENKWKKQIIKYNRYDKLLYSDYETKDVEFECNNCKGNYIIKYYLLYQRSINSHTICTICNSPKENRSSQLQRDVAKFISEFVEVEENYIYSNKNKEELDVYIPSKNIGIEINGLYWHSELHRDKKYHLNKTDNCLINDIKLIHIWEDDWNFKQDIVKSMLINKIGYTSNKIYARKCEVKVITNTKDVSVFLNNNHIQGSIGSNIKLGLYYNEELVSLMTLGKLRKNLGQDKNDTTYELLRFCNLKYTTVIGGASKLFNYLLNNFNMSKIISYSNLEFGYTNFYEKLGFTYTRNTKVGYCYVNNGLREDRFNYRKDILIKEGYDSNLTEHQIMLNRGIYRVYNCGNQFWQFDI